MLKWNNARGQEKTEDLEEDYNDESDNELEKDYNKEGDNLQNKYLEGNATVLEIR